MENFSELIKNRRSMRKFTDEELTQNQVVALMKAALISPSIQTSLANGSAITTIAKAASAMNEEACSLQ